eukprot:2361225-Rhodomonas_salina.2
MTQLRRCTRVPGYPGGSVEYPGTISMRAEESRDTGSWYQKDELNSGPWARIKLIGIPTSNRRSGIRGCAPKAFGDGGRKATQVQL